MAGGTGGMLLFGAIGLVFNFVSYWFSDRIALMAHRAQPVDPGAAPRGLRDRRAARRKAGMPVPRIYVIPSDDAERVRDRAGTPRTRRSR